MVRAQSKKSQKTTASVIWSPKLSAEQMRFYYLHETDPGNPEIYLVRKVHIQGPLNYERLGRALQGLVQTHHLLRTTFSMEGDQPVMELRDQVDCDILRLDLSLLDEAQRTRKLTEVNDAIRNAAEPMSLVDGPLFRIHAVQLKNDEHILFVRAHHIVSDAWGIGVIISKLMGAYESGDAAKAQAETATVPQYDQFIRWESEQAATGTTEATAAYWTAKLGSPGVVDLSRERGRPEKHTTRAATIRVPISKEIRSAIELKSRKMHLTPYVFLGAALQVLLSKTTGQKDILIGAPISARNQPEFLEMPGVFINWIVLRNKLDPQNTFAELAARAMDDASEAIENQTSLRNLFSYAKLSDRNPTRHPLFQVVLNYVRAPLLKQGGGLSFTVEPLFSDRSHFDLSVLFEQAGDELWLNMTYYADCIDAAQANLLAQGYVELLSRFVQNDAEKLADVKVKAGLEPVASTATAHPLVVTATFTAEPLDDVIQFWLQKVRLKAEITFSPLNQVFQELVDPGSAVSSNKLGTNLVLLRFEDWKDPEKHLAEFLELIRLKADQGTAPFVVVLCPPTQKWRTDAALVARQDRMTRDLLGLDSHSRIHVITSEEILKTYPVTELDDPASDEYAKVPYTRDFYVSLGSAIARKVQSILRPAPKVIVLDCDNTLWKGVVGEDGVDGIQVDAGRKYLQEFVMEQSKAGVLLCLCSKNNEADVWEVFEKRGDMPLRREQIVGYRINWMPKSENIKSLAKELNLGVDSFVFLDDSPVECAEVTENCPGVMVFQAPEASGAYRKFVDHLWILDRRKVTDTDRKRTEMYIQNAEREKLKKQAGDLNKFIASLDVKMTYFDLTADNTARVSQMTQRTNQFNFTTVRRSEAEILAAKEAGFKFLIVDVSDRFGDYGIVGLVIYRVEPEAVNVDTFLLSCRALGRGVEQRIVVRLGELAKAAGRDRVDLPFKVSAKNSPARQFLDGALGEFRAVVQEGESYVYRVPVTAALEASSRLVKVEFEDEDKKKGAAAKAPAAAVPQQTWVEILRQLTEVGEISRQVASTFKRSRAEDAGSLVPPRNPREAEVLEIWKTVLSIDQIGVKDNYFSAGGDSIRSLQIASRLKKAGYQVSPFDVLQYPTVEEFVEKCGSSKVTETRKTDTDRTDLQGQAAGPYELSFNQRYLVECYERENPKGSRNGTGAYHIQQVLRLRELKGDFSISALEDALNVLFESHPMTRTHLVRSSSPKQVEKALTRYKLEYSDLKGLTETQQDARVQAYMKDDRQSPFDPYNPDSPLFRLRVFTRSADRIDLFFAFHHGFCDGWGMQEFFGDLLELYFAVKDRDEGTLRQKKEKLASARNVYREFVALEQNSLSDGKSGSFWKATAPRTGEYAPLPPARLSPGAEAEHEVTAVLLPGVVSRATEFGKRLNVPLKAVFLSPLLDSMSRFLGGHPLPLVAEIANGRSDDLSDPLKPLGLYWRYVPVPVAVRADKVEQLRALQKGLIDFERNSVAPLATMVGGGDPEKVINASFNFINFHNSGWRQGTERLQVSNHSFHKFHFPVNFTLRLDGGTGQLHLSVNWSPRYYDSTLVRKLVEDYIASIERTLSVKV